MTCDRISRGRTVAFAGMIVAALVSGPALAKNEGNSHSPNGNSQSPNHSVTATATATTRTSDPDDVLNRTRHTSIHGTKATKSNASQFGKLNGFLHASPEALAHAAPNSAIGKIAKVYDESLKAFLTAAATTTTTTTASTAVSDTGATAPTLSTLKAELTAASNKPLTAATIVKIDAKLASLDPALAAQIEAYPGGATALATAIATAQ